MPTTWDSQKKIRSTFNRWSNYSLLFAVCLTPSYTPSRSCPFFFFFSFLLLLLLLSFVVYDSGKQTSTNTKGDQTASTDPVNQWRSSTLALLRREAHHLHDNTDTFAEAVISRITQLLDSIITSPPPPASASIPPASTSTSTSPSTARGSALRVLVKNSIELARLLVVQKARLRVYMPSILPHQQVLFEPDTMEDIGGEEDEENLASREINCVVFPGVIKHGDENGGHMQYRNVIVKARVLCSPEE